MKTYLKTILLSVFLRKKSLENSGIGIVITPLFAELCKSDSAPSLLPPVRRSGCAEPVSMF